MLAATSRKWAEKGVCERSCSITRRFYGQIHALCRAVGVRSTQGLPVSFVLTGGEASDYTTAEPLMALPLPKPTALLADKGYDKSAC
ncbi:hypothetical protein GCM10023208_07040 [Erythrobacter westpacificensis]|uniref:Transposase IS4-like domain-containing protein n=1 Tax=Erythrobacter westpacificensis TaxID=1055231 RepID=A0ABP9K457_9SPHN